MRITSVQRPPRRRQYDILIDHVLLVRLSPETLAQFPLRPGDEITEAQVGRLEEHEARRHAFATATRLLAYRQRSEAELRDALARRGVGAALLDEVIARLQELRLIDDEAFAQTWVESRDQRSPRGRRLIAAELRAKKVGPLVVERSVAQVDEADAAYRAAARKARSLAGQPYPDFRRRLGDLLLRRGFGYETAAVTVKRLWLEAGGAASGIDDE